MENNYPELEFLSSHLQPLERQEEFLCQLKKLHDTGIIHDYRQYDYFATVSENQVLFVFIHDNCINSRLTTDSKSASDFLKNFATENNFTSLHCWHINASNEACFSHNPVPHLILTLNKANVLLISNSEVAASWFERVVILGFNKSGKIAPRYISVQPSKKTETDFGILVEYKGRGGGRKFILR